MYGKKLHRNRNNMIEIKVLLLTLIFYNYIFLFALQYFSTRLL